MRIKKRKNRSNNLIFLLIILLTSISIGYARFSGTLQIIGTANANGKFCLEFISGKITNCQGIDAINSFVIISENKDTVNINIKDMKYPGSGATVTCIVKNSGTVAAKLKGINITGNNDPDISVEIADSLELNSSLGVGETTTIKLIIKWNIESEINTNKTINFAIKLDYEQDVQEYQGV